MQSKVSIIIPVYNTEQFLRECLNSVCNQSYANLEIICVDDGSSDNSLEILREYAKNDKRIIVLTQQNSGQAAARNAALRRATGDWIGALDSDDFFEPDAIREIMMHADDSIDVIHFGIRWYDETGASKKPKTGSGEKGIVPVTEKLITQSNPSFCDKLWKKSLLDSCNIFFPEGLQMEDLAFTRCCLSMANYMYCMTDEQLYVYRFRPGSTMELHRKKQGGRKILDYIKVADFCLQFWKERNIRSKFGSALPCYLEMEMIQNIKNCILWWGANEYLHEAWMGIRNLIDKYGLGVRLPDFHDLATYYHLPPYAHGVIKWMITHYSPASKTSDENLRRDMALLTNKSSIYWSYRRAQILRCLTWGNKRRKYKEKEEHYHSLLRRCRLLSKELKKKLV